VIEAEPDRLRQVDGIGAPLAHWISSSRHRDARPAGTELYIHMAFAEKRGKRHRPLPNQRRRKTTLIGSPTGLADISARLGRQDNRLICQ